MDEIAVMNAQLQAELQQGTEYSRRLGNKLDFIIQQLYAQGKVKGTVDADGVARGSFVTLPSQSNQDRSRRPAPERDAEAQKRRPPPPENSMRNDATAAVPLTRQHSSQIVKSLQQV